MLACMREWKVAGGLLADERGLLLVANTRRNGSIDWTTPGGVIDEGESPIEALGREVAEETGLYVPCWERLCWTVSVEFIEMEMSLDVEVHLAESFEGKLDIDDPDGIVTAAEFVDRQGVVDRLTGASLWVAEPLHEWVAGPWNDVRHYDYVARGSRSSELRAERRNP
jgi:ADP-ribose pyrophosphatase YjhB (NUDIX family)